jgi:hypothetical protein
LRHKYSLIPGVKDQSGQHSEMPAQKRKGRKPCFYTHSLSATSCAIVKGFIPTSNQFSNSVDKDCLNNLFWH